MYAYIKDSVGNLVNSSQTYNYNNEDSVSFTFNNIPFDDNDGYIAYVFFDNVVENGENDDYEPMNSSNTLFVNSSNPATTADITLSLPAAGMVSGTITVPANSIYTGKKIIVQIEDENGNIITDINGDELKN